jgi:metal-responsive CopG/Arc/MetJ family transcriptional regulator
MKEKTSITLSSDILARVDQVAGSKFSRSAFIEHVLRNYFRERSKRRIHARDLERINAAADRLNSEAADVLDYQAPED